MATKEVLIRKTDDYLHLVYGIVYSPNDIDAHNEFMSSDAVRAMAYKFMMGQKLSKIDTDHDNIENGSMVVESFIASGSDEEFPEGSWVLVVFVPDEEIWAKVLANELNGFSFEGMSTVAIDTVPIEVAQVYEGETDVSDDHNHDFIVTIKADGKLSGSTSYVNGHNHRIIHATLTEESMTHNHRFTIIVSN